MVGCYSKHPATSNINRRPPNLHLLSSDQAFEQRGDQLMYGDFPFSGYLDELYENGKIKSITGYLDGRRHDTAKTWYSNGKLKSMRYFTNGKKDGQHQGWWPNDSLKFEFNFEGGYHEGTQFSYYPDGQISHLRNYKDGHEDGTQRAWSTSGKLVSNYIIKDKKRYGFIGRKDCISVYEPED